MMKKTALLMLAPLAAAFSLTACGDPTRDLGPAAEDAGLRGTTTAEQVFTGGPSNTAHTTIAGDALVSGGRYRINGTLTILGNLPEDVRIDVNNGKLTVTGDVGAESRIDVQLPVLSHTDSVTVLMPVPMSCGQNCTTTTMLPQTSYHTVIDGFQYPDDTGPALRVDGRIGENVRIHSNGNVVASGWSDSVTLRTAGAPRGTRIALRPQASG